jgi:hypothetical protein
VRAKTRSKRPAHVLLVVENISLARDHRLRKQAETLITAGYRVTVICRRDPGNRAVPGVRVRDYRAPADGRSKVGFAREYGYSLIRAGWLIARTGAGVVAVTPHSPGSRRSWRSTR